MSASLPGALPRQPAGACPHGTRGGGRGPLKARGLKALARGFSSRPLKTWGPPCLTSASPAPVEAGPADPAAGGASGLPSCPHHHPLWGWVPPAPPRAGPTASDCPPGTCLLTPLVPAALPEPGPLLQALHGPTVLGRVQPLGCRAGPSPPSPPLGDGHCLLRPLLPPLGTHYCLLSAWRGAGLRGLHRV